jgi:Pyridoxamine 5'-phosphate oxidase
MTQQHARTPRSISERREAARDTLRAHHQLWLATGRDSRGAHLIPVSFLWDRVHLTMATLVRSRTMTNLRANPTARAAVGRTDDVVMIDGDVTLVDVAGMDPEIADRYARVSHDPRAMPGFVYLRLTPVRIQVWNGFHEYGGRTVMLDGRWLDEPID